MKYLILSAVLFLSCTSEKKDAQKPPESANGALTGSPACSDYTAEECGLNESCHAIRGFDLDKDRLEFIGCMDISADGGFACNDAISCFTDPTRSRKVILTNGCHPKDWENAECSEDDQKSLDDFFSQGGSF